MKHVLIIEDDAWLADSYGRTIEGGGFSVTTVQYAEAAIDILDKIPTDLIIADMLLDTNTVLPLLHELQTYTDTQQIPVVVCTSLDSSSIDVDVMRSYGVVLVLNKATLTPEQLIMSVREQTI
jgi:DNA-binding response OmpR family regulator